MVSESVSLKYTEICDRNWRIKSVDIKTVLTDAIIKTAKNAIAAGVVKDGTLPEVQLTVPPKKEFGDFASNFAMQSARALRCNPRVLAQYIVENLDCPYVKKAEIAGPGFINFYSIFI